MCSIRSFTAALVVSLALGGCSPRLSEEELVARAADALSRGDLNAAELDIKSALQQDPNSPEARTLYGKLYLRQVNPGAAVDEFERAIRDAPAAPPATRLLLAKALVQAGEGEQLLEEISDRQYATLRDNPELAAAEARALLAQTDFDAAREALDRAVSGAATSGEQYDYIDVTRALFALQLDQAPEAAEKFVSAVTARNPDNAEAWSLRGTLANRGGELEAAEDYFAKAAALNPYRLFDRIQLVSLQLQLGQSAEAEEGLRGLERAIPNSPAVNFLRGRVQFEAGDYKDATESFSRVLSAVPDHPGALFLGANANVRENNLVSAQRQLSRLLSQRPGSLEVGLQLGSLYLQMQEPENAEQVARDTLKEHAMNTKVLGLLATALAAQGMNAESVQTYQQIAALQPESAEAQLALGSQQVSSGDLDAGIERLKAAVALDPDSAAARERLIEAHLAAGHLEAAAAAARAYVEREPESARAAVLLGTVQLRDDDYESARASFDRAESLDPANSAAVNGVAAMAMLDDEPEGAKEALERGLERSPGDLRISMSLAALHERAGDTQAMTDVLNAAIVANPDAVAPRLALARRAIEQRQPLEAINLLAPVEEANSEDARILQLLTGAYLAADQPAAAAASARELLALAPDSPNALALAARAEAVNGRNDRAEQYLKQALAFAPSGASDLRKLLIESLVAQGKLTEAAEEIGRLPPDVQEEVPVTVLRGRLAMEAGDVEAGKALFESAFERQRSSANLALLAAARWRLGEREQAISELRLWLDEFPQDAVTRSGLASLELQMGNESAAVEEYEKILAQQPDSALVLNNLAWLKRKKDPQLALDYARRADELAPNSPQVKDTFAMVELAAGNTTRALALNDKALSAAPGNPDISYNRAQILLAAGRSDEAQSLLRDLIAGPDFASRKEAEALLQTLPN